jgi:hypothetical protein
VTYDSEGNVKENGTFAFGNYIDYTSIQINKFLETRLMTHLEFVTTDDLTKFLSKKWKTTFISKKEGKHHHNREFLIEKIIENHKKSIKEDIYEIDYVYDIFGNEIIQPCKGTDDNIYDLFSMKYMFSKNKDGEYENIPSSSDENGNKTIHFPVMANGKVLNNYTMV